MDGKKVITAVFMLACFTGLMWQVVLISQMYFAYKVNTRISIEVPDDTQPVATSLCIRFTDILEFDRLNAGTGRNWSYSLVGSDIQKYQDELTVRQIFEYTPATNNTIDHIMLRDNDSYDRIKATDRRLYDYFHVMKYINLEHVCYRFRMKRAKIKSYSFYSVTPTAPGVIYEIYLSQALRRADPIKVCMHDQDTLPYRSLKIEPVIWRQFSAASQRSDYSMFISYQMRLASHLLPSPYETHCYDYSPTFVSDAHCVQECVMRESVKEFGLVPFSPLITDASINRTMISVIDLRNKTLVRKLLEMEKICSQRTCLKKQCNMATSMTMTQSLSASEFGIKAIVPSQPWVTVTSAPTLNIVEFLTYIMSTISTWTGISIISFMPSKLAKLSRRLKSKTRSEQQLIIHPHMPNNRRLR